MEEQEIILEKENRKEQEIILESENISSSGIEDIIVNGKSVVSDNIANIEIPSKTSDLENDNEYTTKEYVDGLIGDTEILLGGI